MTHYKPFKNIAVTLRGHIRTWNYTRPAIFKFYEQLAENVDYYYATWQLPYLDSQKLNSTFDSVNLIQHHLVHMPVALEFKGCRLGPSYLSSHIQLKKDYDCVIDSRFDAVPVLLSDDIKKPADNEIMCVQWLLPQEVEACMSDQYAIMTNSTFYKFATKLDYLKKTVKRNIKGDQTYLNEIHVRRACERLKINLTTQTTWATNYLVRPNIIDIFPSSLSITAYSWDQVHHQGWVKWPELTLAEKINYCKQCDCDLRDYLV